MAKRQTKKEANPPNPEFSGDRGLNVDPNPGPGLSEAQLLVINDNRRERGESILSPILIAKNGYYSTVVVPFLLQQGLGISSTADVTASRGRLAIPDSAKIYKPRSNQITAETGDGGDTSSGRAQTDIDGSPSMRRRAGKKFTIMFADALDARYNNEVKTDWIKCGCIWTGSEVSLAAMALWLFKFADPAKIPPKFKLQGRWRLMSNFHSTI